MSRGTRSDRDSRSDLLQGRLPLRFSLACHRLLATAALLAACATPMSVHCAPRDPIHATVARHIQNGDIPGAVVLLLQHGRTVASDVQGVADNTQQQPLRGDTVFWAASMTKPLISVSILMLQERGQLQLSDLISRYIPEFSAPTMVRVLRRGAPADAPLYDLVPARRALTIRDLLTHTAGLQSIGVPNPAIPPIGDNDTLGSWVPRLASVPLDFEPGSRWAYSNATGYEVLARIVEIASGQALHQFVQQQLFEPLQMSDSSFGFNPASAARNQPLPAALLNNPCINGRHFDCGSAGLWTTAEDYAHFAQMLLNGGRWHGHRLLRTDTVSMLSANQTGRLFAGASGVGPDGVGFGLGVLTVTDPVAAHLSVPSGSFGWDGVGARRFWVIPKADAVLLIMIPGGKTAAVQRDVEHAAMTQLDRRREVR